MHTLFPLTKVYRAIIIIVEELNEPRHISQLDVVLAENVSDFICSDHSILVDVKQSEGIIDAESLVARKGSTCVFNPAILLDHEFDHAEKHEVLDLTLLFEILQAFLLLSYFLFLSLDVLIDFSSLLLCQALFLIPLLLSLGWGQIVSRWPSGAFPC